MLLLRFYEVSEGEILLDDINIKDYDIEFLRRIFGVVSQEPHMFNDTIRFNIWYCLLFRAIFMKMPRDIKDLYIFIKIKINKVTVIIIVRNLKLLKQLKGHELMISLWKKVIFKIIKKS